MRFGSTSIGGEKLDSFRESDAPSAEKAGIDGPDTRSDHCQDDAKERLYDGHPWIARLREKPRSGDPDLDDGCQRSRHGGPQTDQKKDPRTDPDDFRNDGSHRRCRRHAGDPEIDQPNGRKHPQEQKTYAGPTISERRE